MTETLTTLTEQLHHLDSNMRSQAAIRIGELGDVSALDALLQALVVEPELFVREDLTWALVRMGDAAVQPLIDLLSHANPAARHHAAHTLGKIGDARAVDGLSLALQDSDANVIQKVAFALSQIGDTRAVAALVPLVGHENTEVQAAVARALESFGAASVQPLTTALTDARWQVREQAADILGQIGDQAAVPAVIQTLQDAHWQVRFAAVTALGHLGGASARDALRNLPPDNNERVQGLVPKVMKRLKV